MPSHNCKLGRAAWLLDQMRRATTAHELWAIERQHDALHELQHAVEDASEHLLGEAGVCLVCRLDKCTLVGGTRDA